MTPIGTAPRWVVVHVAVAMVGVFILGYVGGKILGDGYLDWAFVVIPLLGTALLVSLAWRYSRERGRTASDVISYVRLATIFLGLAGSYGFRIACVLPLAVAVAVNLWARSDPSRKRASAS